MKVLVIGLDGATWRIMDPLIKAERLPNIKKLIKEGARGTLYSTIPPITPPAWTSIATGVNPGKHGIYGFHKQNRESYQVSPISYTFETRPGIWDIFNLYNKKVCIINFPLAFPPRKVDSIFVSGFGALEREIYTYPKELYETLKQKNYRIYPSFGPQNGAKRYLNEVKELTDIQANLALEFMKKYEWELFWLVFHGLDWIQHYLWDESINGKSGVEDFYCYMDSVIGKILKCSQDDWNIIIISDHGFQKIKAEIYLNNLLEEWGYLKRGKKSGPKLSQVLLKFGWKLGLKFPFKIKQYLKKNMPKMIDSISQKVSLEPEYIEYSQTQAFSYGYMGCIYIHLKDKYSKGKVSAKEYKSLQDKIIDRLKSLKDPINKEKIIGEIYKKQDIYKGDQTDEAPDIVFNPANFSYMFYGKFAKKWYQKPKERFADHDTKGIFIIKGKDIKKNIQKDIKAADIAPTILYLHNLPIVEDMDGKIIKEVIKEERIKTQRIKTIKDIKIAEQEKKEYDLEEQKEIERRLRDLGYM